MRDPYQKATLEAVRQQIAVSLDEIATLFRSPRITLLVRSPDLPDGDLLLTDDDLNAVIPAIQRLMERNERG